MREQQRRESSAAVGGQRSRAGSRVRSRAARLYAAAFVATIFFGLVIVRLWDLQVRRADNYAGQAQRQHEGVIPLRATRGAIFDRNGTELALSTPVESIGVFPRKVSDPAWTSAVLGQVLDMDPAAIAPLLAGDSFRWIKRLAEPRESERLKGLQLKALHFEKESKRYYPKGPLAAHALGFVDVDHKGLAGMERAFEEKLSGRDGARLVQYDAARQRYETRIVQPPVPGANLYLTIDERVQSAAEAELERAIEETGARAGTIVIVEPRGGDVLAIANWPAFDPNRRARVGEGLNFAISHRYEPGSTFKLVTVSAALEEGVTHPLEVFDCQDGYIYIGRRRISDHKRLGMLTLEQVVAHSSNVGVIQLGLRLGAAKLHSHVTKFGFGAATGIELPGEAAGTVHPRSIWREGSVASVSMGYEIAVTPLQMAQAMAVIANGGLRTAPRLVDAVEEVSGVRRALPRPEPERVIGARTAATVRGMLEKVVLEGTGRLAQAPGYRVAGKSGTARMIDQERGGYQAGEYMASFAGFAPVNDPAIVALVVLEAPRGRFYYGGQIAAPVFSRTVSRVLRLLDLAPDRLQEPAPSRPGRMPPLVLADLAAEIPSAEPEEFWSGGDDGVVLVGNRGSGWDDSGEENGPALARPAIGIRVTPVEAPDLRGMPLRRAALEASQLGLRIASTGAGVALSQSPRPGAPVEPGSLLRVEFGRKPRKAGPVR